MNLEVGWQNFSIKVDIIYDWKVYKNYKWHELKFDQLKSEYNLNIIYQTNTKCNMFDVCLASSVCFFGFVVENFICIESVYYWTRSS